MKITTTLDPDYALCRIEGSLSNEHLKDAEKEIGRLIQKNRHIILDFSGLNFISSSVLSFLLQYNDRVREKGLFLALSEVRPDIQKLFDITNIAGHLNIFETTDEAIKYIQRNPDHD